MNQNNNEPMHGVKLEKKLIEFQERYAWDGMTERIDSRLLKKSND